MTTMMMTPAACAVVNDNDTLPDSLLTALTDGGDPVQADDVRYDWHGLDLLSRPHEMLIRPARTEDVPQIADLIEPFVEEGQLLRRTYAEFDELLPNFFVAVAEEIDGLGETRIVGCAALEVYSPKLAEIRSLAVSRTVQGRGVGKMLVQACIDRARERGILEVMAITSSDGFFQSCGFDYTLPGAKRALFVQTRDTK